MLGYETMPGWGAIAITGRRRCADVFAMMARCLEFHCRHWGARCRPMASAAHFEGGSPRCWGAASPIRGADIGQRGQQPRHRGRWHAL